MLSDNLCESVWSLKLKAGSKMIPVTVTKKGERLYLKFPYSPKMIEEVKAFDGHKWHGYEDPPEKTWSIKDSLRNRFQLDSLAHPGVNDPENPYRRYNEPLLEFLARRKIYVHQNDLAAHGFTRRQCIIASEMGTGKTLAAIEIMEASQLHDWIWVGPKSALVSVRLEFIKWQAKILPTFVTYEGLQKLLADWPEGKKAPHGVIFDECSRLKNPTAKRTQAARHLADSIRAEWGAKGFVILMSGTPSPKSPADWWSLCEIACPGFLREGTHEKFKQRLAITEMREQFAGGGAYSHLLSWKDDSRKCAKCGLLEKDETHDSGINVFGETSTQHKFEPTVNEVALLFQRMKGLVVVKFKKDCFSGETNVLTKHGIKSLRDLAKIGHGELYVLTDSGMQWIDCPVKSFGQNTTIPLTFGDGHIVRTTAHHEWLYREKGVLKGKKFTFELREGYTELPLAEMILPEPSEEGYAHGFVFGDGCRIKNNPTDISEHCIVPLYSHDTDLKPLLLKFGSIGSVYRGDGWDSYLDTIRNLPKEWKDLPKNPDRAYALGFVLGLVAADGCVDEHLRVYQANFEHLKECQNLARFAGLRTSPLNLARQKSPFDGSDKPLYYFSIQTYNLNPEWILRTDHRAKLKIRGRKTSTTVRNIDWGNPKIEETFCAVVPKWHNFTLANGVISGNCLDLPDKVYREIVCTPSRSMLNAARAIEAKSTSTIQALTLLRELSDGFQYFDRKDGTKICPSCGGRKTVNVPKEEILEEITAYAEIEYVTKTCSNCSGSGIVDNIVRDTRSVPSPKDDALRDLMDEYDEIGRMVVYGGFTGTIDRISELASGKQWKVIRVDGRGWHTDIPGLLKPEDMMNVFQHSHSKYPRIIFDGHPGSAGMGLTLTASPVIVYFSNDFNAESRIQSEDRIHRAGMDTNRGATIIDLLHLPTDKLVLDNLKTKRRLQDMTLGELYVQSQAAEQVLTASQVFARL